MVTVCYAAQILFTAHRKDTVRIVQSTGTVKPQAHPTMLYLVYMVAIIDSLPPKIISVDNAKLRVMILLLVNNNGSCS